MDLESFFVDTMGQSIPEEHHGAASREVFLWRSHWYLWIIHDNCVYTAWCHRAIGPCVHIYIYIYIYIYIHVNRSICIYMFDACKQYRMSMYDSYTPRCSCSSLLGHKWCSRVFRRESFLGAWDMYWILHGKVLGHGCGCYFQIWLDSQLSSIWIGSDLITWNYI